MISDNEMNGTVYIKRMMGCRKKMPWRMRTHKILTAE